MSTKSKLSNAFLMIQSNIKLVFNKITGTDISFSPKSLVSMCSTIKTDNHGHISIGSMTAIRSNTEISANGGIIAIKNNCFINKNCMIISHERIEIGEFVTIGPNVCIYDHDHDGQGGYVSKPVIIGKNVWIGAGCILLKGIDIGDNAIIGAGTVVTKNIAANTITYTKRENQIRSI